MAEMGSSSMAWTIITVTYNSSKSLEALQHKDLPEDVEWLVVDNCSTDCTVKIAVTQGASRVISLKTNSGFAAGNNVALEQARGKYVLFANPDLDFDVRDLPRLQEEVDRESGLVSPQLMNHDGTLQPNGRGFPTPISKIRNRLGGASSRRYQVFAQRGEITSACFLMGASIATTVNFMRKLGGWDERYFLYYEDHDLGIRTWLHGGSVRVIGDIRWTHGWARETKRLAFTPWRREIESAVPFFVKYPTLLFGVSASKRRWPEISAAIGVSHDRIKDGSSRG